MHETLRTLGESSIAHMFSLVGPGPSYKHLRRFGFYAHNHTNRILLWFALTWVPLAILSWVQGVAWGNKVTVPLFWDCAVYGRFFVALPLLLVAENVIDRFVHRAAVIFDSSGLVKQDQPSLYRSTLERVTRLRESGYISLALLLVALIPFFLMLPGNEWTSNQMSTWHGLRAVGLSLAGWWFVFVSSPTLRFLMLRWLWRYALWVYLLRKVSRSDIVLLPAHPDRLGGLGFLLFAQRQFGILAAALGTVVAGHFANEIIYLGEPLRAIKAPAGVFVFASLLVILFPLSLFTLRLFEARYDVLVRNNQVARIVTGTFDAKWAQNIGDPTGAMIGSQDPSSLIDYISSYDVLRQTRAFPINRNAVFYIAGLAGAPFAFVWLLTTPFEGVVTEILKRLF